MKNINVEDLPEPVIKALSNFVQKLRKQLRAKAKRQKHVELPVWSGKTIGRLSRREIYEQVE